MNKPILVAALLFLTSVSYVAPAAAQSAPCPPGSVGNQYGNNCDDEILDIPEDLPEDPNTNPGVDNGGNVIVDITQGSVTPAEPLTPQIEPQTETQTETRAVPPVEPQAVPAQEYGVGLPDTGGALSVSGAAALAGALLITGGLLVRVVSHKR